jgi:hypothetical protein
VGWGGQGGGLQGEEMSESSGGRQAPTQQSVGFFGFGGNGQRREGINDVRCEKEQRGQEDCCEDGNG